MFESTELILSLRSPRRHRFHRIADGAHAAVAGGERGSRLSQAELGAPCERVRATENASRGPFNLFELRHGLAEIVERGPGVVVERLRVNPPHFEREFMTLTDTASRDGYRFAEHRPGFFKALLSS